MYATFWGGVVIKESRLAAPLHFGHIGAWKYFAHTLSTHPFPYHFTCIVSCKCNGVDYTLCLSLTWK